MDLNTWESECQPTSGSADARFPAEPYRNDAFSFWKLPEAWRRGTETLIDESERQARHYLFEEYLEDHRRRPSRMLDYYYAVKGLIPPPLRHRLNSIAIRSRRRPAFPDWPCEDALLRVWRRALAALMEPWGAQDAWHIGFWPEGKSCCVVLTHDVESPRGLAAMERMAELEESYGLRSAWNLALEQYPIDWEKIDALRARGFEFGAHGLRHDGRLFRSERDFREQAARIRRIADEHGLRGFRAPSTLRRAQWIPRLGFDFDSSFSDTDIFEPQPGGTCSIFPFFLDTVVELPYTLPQDHTLIHLLGQDLLSAWIRKARWIASLGGLILTLVHPDYCGEGVHFQAYERLLQHLSSIHNAWRALPSQVAQWWRQRADAELHIIQGQPVVRAAHAATVPRLLSQEPLGRWEFESWPASACDHGMAG
jgi:peptidoglycan/xylan/chitin deacetylase (PgdA/CDA1 family)